MILLLLFANLFATASERIHEPISVTYCSDCKRMHEDGKHVQTNSQEYEEGDILKEVSITYCPECKRMHEEGKHLSD
ncbi:MAG: hypothetical protein ChlgKO_02890 [Chlamydiales bacterium]